MIVPIGSESNSSARTLTVGVLAWENGVQMIQENLDESYAVEATNQQNLNLVKFRDYMWEKIDTVEKFIAGFHDRLHK